MKNRTRRGEPVERPRAEISIGGVRITHPDKLWWPGDGITKGDVAAFYDRISPAILPWLKDRPLTAERCPGGMAGPCFFQKNFPDAAAAGIPTVPIRAESTGKIVNYVVGGTKKALLTLVNFGCIAIHVMNCRKDSLDQPDWLAFDLDPSSGGFAAAARAGLLLRDILEEEKIRSFPKTSGSRGLHVFVPLARGATQDGTRAFAAEIGRRLAERAPKLVTVEMSKARRGSRVFADALRNAFGQTIVPPYSVRRRPKAPVSTPLDWSEVDPKLDPARFNLGNFEKRLASADPWKGFWKSRQTVAGAGSGDGSA
ncbi:MAG TPA: non-homologous end-joining DNA ligase [Thermoanaerobaculia bacterium]|nr:non-homologous end-joining DNA ligase [Thermoanaerobaculia bacterium]